MSEIERGITKIALKFSISKCEFDCRILSEMKNDSITVHAKRHSLKSGCAGKN